MYRALTLSIDHPANCAWRNSDACLSAHPIGVLFHFTDARRSSMNLALPRWSRQVTFAWLYGNLAPRVIAASTAALLLVLAVSTWQGLRAWRQSERLAVRVAKLEATRDASVAAIQAAEPPDFVQTLRDAPSVSQVMQTMQQAADKEGAHVISLQADDHAPTATALGHLDLLVSIKAPYPSIVIVIQQVLDRYPGATLRQLSVAHAVATALPGTPPPAAGPTTLAPMSESEAHVTFAFWRRPLGVDAVSTAQQAIAEAAASSAPLAAPAASAPASAPYSPEASRTGAVVLPPVAPRASSGSR